MCEERVDLDVRVSSTHLKGLELIADYTPLLAHSFEGPGIRTRCIFRYNYESFSGRLVSKGDVAEEGHTGHANRSVVLW